MCLTSGLHQRLWALLFSVSSLTACERHTRLQVTQDNPPKFEMSGSGSLARFRVRGPKVRDVLGEDQYVVWQIEVKSGSWGEDVESLSPLTYGKVPAGYVQKYPEQGEAPPLTEGEVYYVRVDTNNANGAFKHFVLKQGKVVSADYPYELQGK